MRAISYSLAGAMLLAIAITVSCKKDENGDMGAIKPAAKPSVAFVTNGVANFWTIAEAGVNAAAEEFDCNADVRMPNGIMDQNRVIEELISKNVDGIAISPIDGVNQNEKINEAAARTHLITHDSDAADSDRLLYIGMDNYTAGRMCGQLVKEAMPNGGEVMRHRPAAARRDRQGDLRAVSHPDYG